MANVCSNAIFCEDMQSYMAVRAFIDKYDSLNFNLICPQPGNNKDLLKEIADCIDETSDYYLEKYNVKDLWKHMYWGTTGCCDVMCIDDKLVITFKTAWNPPFGIIKALWDRGIKFKFYFNDEADNGIHDLQMDSNLEMVSDDITDINVVRSMAEIFECPLWLDADEDED